MASGTDVALGEDTSTSAAAGMLLVPTIHERGPSPMPSDGDDDLVSPTLAMDSFSLSVDDSGVAYAETRGRPSMMRSNSMSGNGTRRSNYVSQLSDGALAVPVVALTPPMERSNSWSIRGEVRPPPHPKA